MNILRASVTVSWMLATFAMVSGCSSSGNGEADHDLGTVTAGTYQVHVIQEGTYRPTNTTKYAIQPNGTKPDSVECWFGSATSTPHVPTVYDPNDNDWDCTLTTPAAPAATDQVWFTVKAGATSGTASITPQP
jgi:hypothetical protein